MDLLGVEAHALAARRHHSAPEPCGGGPAPVPVALIIDPELRVGLGVLPPRIAFDRHAGGTDHLVLGEVERHVVRRELAVELTGRIKRMVLPSEAVVDRHLRIPLREIEPPAASPLAPREPGRNAFRCWCTKKSCRVLGERFRYVIRACPLSTPAGSSSLAVIR